MRTVSCFTCSTHTSDTPPPSLSLPPSSLPFSTNAFVRYLRLAALDKVLREQAVANADEPQTAAAAEDVPEDDHTGKGDGMASRSRSGLDWRASRPGEPAEGGMDWSLGEDARDVSVETARGDQW